MKLITNTLNNMEQNNNAQELREALNKGFAQFSYEKKDGTWREATGTRNPDGIESVDGEAPKGTGHEKAGTIAYWDVDVAGWRSCCEDKIISVNRTWTPDEFNNEYNN